MRAGRVVAGAVVLNSNSAATACGRARGTARSRAQGELLGSDRDGAGPQAGGLRGGAGLRRVPRRPAAGRPDVAMVALQALAGLRRPGEAGIQADCRVERGPLGAPAFDDVPGVPCHGHLCRGLREGRHVLCGRRRAVRNVPWAGQRARGSASCDGRGGRRAGGNVPPRGRRGLGAAEGSPQRSGPRCRSYRCTSAWAATKRRDRTRKC